MTTTRAPHFDIQIALHEYEHAGETRYEVGVASYYIDIDSEDLNETTVFGDASYPNLGDVENPKDACIDALGVDYGTVKPDLTFLPSHATEPGIGGVWFSERALDDYWDKFDPAIQNAIMRVGSGHLIQARLEYLRGELRSESISYGELAELQSLAAHIDPGDVELLEAAGVPE